MDLAGINVTGKIRRLCASFAQGRRHGADHVTLTAAPMKASQPQSELGAIWSDFCLEWEFPNKPDAARGVGIIENILKYGIYSQK
jgi:hypothetical protein